MDPIVLLKELVAIDSVNPSLVAGAAGEGAIARRLAGMMGAAGMTVTLEESAPGRPNAIGVVEGRAPGRTLMFCGHIDTVGVSGMTRPFDPVERGGRLYGRGSQDMKGGVAAMVAAAAKIAASGLERGRLVVACVTDEEWKSIGADALVRNWPADAAIVTEPTDLQIGVAHKGFGWVEVETRGVAAHGSRPADGRDAIFRHGTIAGCARRARWHAAGAARRRSAGSGVASCIDAYMAGASGARIPIAACSSSNVGPSRASPRRGRSTKCATSSTRCVTRTPDSKVTPRSSSRGRPIALTSAPRSSRRSSRRARRVVVRGRRLGLSFWTDAAILGAAGMQTAIFGPGGAGLHSVEEYVETAQVVACRDILVELTRRYLS